MGSVKFAEILTCGKGMGDSQLTQWLLSRLVCADMNSAFQEITGKESAVSNQHAKAQTKKG